MVLEYIRKTTASLIWQVQVHQVAKSEVNIFWKIRHLDCWRNAFIDISLRSIITVFCESLPYFDKEIFSSLFNEIWPTIFYIQHSHLYRYVIQSLNRNNLFNRSSGPPVTFCTQPNSTGWSDPYQQPCETNTVAAPLAHVGSYRIGVPCSRSYSIACRAGYAHTEDTTAGPHQKAAGGTEREIHGKGSKVGKSVIFKTSKLVLYMEVYILDKN